MEKMNDGNTSLTDTSVSLFGALRDGTTRRRQEAWQLFDDRYRPLIIAFAKSLGAPDDLAHDVAQDVFLRFFSASSGFSYDRSKGKFRNYLCQCTAHALADVWKKRSRQPHSTETSNLQLLACDTPESEQLWEREWKRTVVLEAFARTREYYQRRKDMPQSYAAFEMCVRFDIPIDIVCKELEMSPDAVMKARSRVASTFRKMLDELTRRDF